MALPDRQISRQGDITRLEQVSLPAVEMKTPDRGRFVLPLIHRGGNNHEIAQLTGLSLAAVAGKRTESGAQINNVTSLKTGEIVRAEAIAENDTVTTFAKDVLDAGLIGEDLQYWNGLRTIYESAGRTLPASFSTQIALEAFIKTRRDLRLGETGSWNAYKKIREDKKIEEKPVVLPTVAKEEEFLRAVYRRTPEEKERALGKITAHREALIIKALPIVGDFHDAEDVAQEALAKLLRAIDSDDSAYPFDRPEPDRDLYYALATVRNLAIDKLRKKEREAEPDPLDDDSLITHGLVDNNTPERIFFGSGISRVEEIIADLPPRQQETVLLRIVDGLSDTEVGALMNIEPVSVRTNISRVRAKLRNHRERAS